MLRPAAKLSHSSGQNRPRCFGPHARAKRPTPVLSLSGEFREGVQPVWEEFRGGFRACLGGVSGWGFSRFSAGFERVSEEFREGFQPVLEEFRGGFWEEH